MLLSDMQLTGLRGQRENAFDSVVTVLTHTTGMRGPLNETEISYVPGASYPCAFVARPGRDLDEHGLPLSDGEIKLPLSALAVLRPRDRLRLTSAKGTVLTQPLDFAVVGNPLPGITVLRVAVKSIVGESPK